MTHLTGQAEAALMSLYEQEKRTTDNFAKERIERALDEIVRLNSTDPPARQVRSAMANASKVILSRRETVAAETLEARQVEIAAPGGDEDVTDLKEWLRRTPGVTERQRTLLSRLADGHDAADLAAVFHIPADRMREQISRTRRAARTPNHHEVRAA